MLVDFPAGSRIGKMYVKVYVMKNHELNSFETLKIIYTLRSNEPSINIV